jgi:hypothetical protein
MIADCVWGDRGICMTCMGLVHNYEGLMTAVRSLSFPSYILHMSDV